MFTLPLSELSREIGLIALFAVFTGLSGYCGYHWYEAAKDRDKAVEERDGARAERDAANVKVGELQTLVTRQNAAVTKAAEATTRAGELYQDAVKRNKEFGNQLQPLINEVSAARSVNCNDAIAHQRRIIESLNKTRKGPQ